MKFFHKLFFDLTNIFIVIYVYVCMYIHTYIYTYIYRVAHIKHYKSITIYIYIYTNNKNRTTIVTNKQNRE